MKGGVDQNTALEPHFVLTNILEKSKGSVVICILVYITLTLNIDSLRF